MAEEESDTEEILALYLYARRRRKRNRRVAVHEILQRMPIYGEYHHLVQELYFHPDKFRRYFRMTKEQFDRLLGLIEDDIQKKKQHKMEKRNHSKRTTFHLFKVSSDA